MLKTIVIYNKNIPESANLAEIYRLHRNIPLNQLIGLDLRPEEHSVISFDRFKTLIYQKLAKDFVARGWVVPGSTIEPDIPNLQQDVGWIVPIKGVPWKVWSMDSQGRVTKFCPDSYITHCCWPRWQNGIPEIRYIVENPFLKQYKEREEFPNVPLSIVGRIDGPSYEEARTMLEKTIAAEHRSLVLGDFLFDARSPTDWDIIDAANLMQAEGYSVLVDQRGELLGPYFPSENSCFYVGWYNAQPQGPFHISRSQLPLVGWHIYSLAFCNLLSDWAAYFVRNGFVGSIGSVYEPMAGSYPNTSIFVESFFQYNLSLGEAFYNTPCHLLNWMFMILGDPHFRLDIGTGTTEWDEINKDAIFHNIFQIVQNNRVDPNKCAAAMIKNICIKSKEAAQMVIGALKRDGTSITDYALKMAYWQWWLLDPTNRTTIMQRFVKVFGGRF